MFIDALPWLQSDGMYDPSDEYYKPEVDLNDKPWFQADDKPDIRVQTAKNMSRMLRGVPVAYVVNAVSLCYSPPVRRR